MRLIILMFVNTSLILQAFAADPISLRFSASTISALAAATESTITPLIERPPHAEYDKKNKRMIMKPVFDWFAEHSQESRTLSPASFKKLSSLLLNSENHYRGLFSVRDAANYVIKFIFDGRSGYITVGNTVVVVYWDDREQGALLNEAGTNALQQWIKENG
jgi:hypothetical protein